jgi:hypothetical protein
MVDRAVPSFRGKEARFVIQSIENRRDVRYAA